MNNRQRDRWLVNLVLSIGAIMLLALLLSDEEQPSPPPRLSDFVTTSPTELTIDRPGKDRIRFQRQNKQWIMTAPYQHVADDNILGRLLSITSLEITSSFSSKGKNLDDFGLADTTATLYLDNTAIHFGDAQPVGEKRYLLIHEKILLVNDQHINQLNISSISYLDRQLVPTDTKLQALYLDNNTVALDDNLKAQWHSIKASWLGLFSDTTLTVNSQRIMIRLEFDNNTSLEYLAIKREHDLVLIKEPFEYHLPHIAIDTLGLDFTEKPSTVSADTSGNTTNTR